MFFIKIKLNRYKQTPVKVRRIKLCTALVAPLLCCANDMHNAFVNGVKIPLIKAMVTDIAIIKYKLSPKVENNFIKANKANIQLPKQ